ncbi:flagellar protein FliT [Rhodanobacter sp. 7MK24]|uniref:flagellar protein FliT n=1 Tax=Rhodanobacter sp. 7MK24 TaxID=2775922 RepID=UPI0017850713|nr:flagellar protein FliT [Rhodanobacter sp. 7MK24]MBD8881910.1 flagellar protein FliT [Rhodanobacter sp. 7MK24]
MSEGHTSLERALEVSNNMLAAAREGQWDSLPKMEVERAPLLRASHPRDDRSRELLEQLLACNEEMLSLAARARAQIADALSRNGYAHRALNTYVGLGR